MYGLNESGVTSSTLLPKRSSRKKANFMKLSKVGFSNSTIMSTSLVSFSSPRAKEPNRPILLTWNRSFISRSRLLKMSIIFIFRSQIPFFSIKCVMSKNKNLPQIRPKAGGQATDARTDRLASLIRAISALEAANSCGSPARWRRTRIRSKPGKAARAVSRKDCLAGLA